MKVVLSILSGIFLPVIACAENTGVKVSIATLTPVIIKGEPLYVSATVTNTGESAVSFVCLNGPSVARGQGVGAILLSTDGTNFSTWTDGMRPPEKAKGHDLPPGGSMEIEFMVLYNRNTGFVFTKGVYYICAEFLIRFGPSTRSAPLQVVVEEPKAEDALAWVAIAGVSRDYAEIIQAHWEAGPEQRNVAQVADILQKHPKSRYIQYFELAVVRSFLERDAPDAKECLKWLGRLEQRKMLPVVRQKLGDLHQCVKHP